MFTTLNDLKEFIGIPNKDTLNDSYLFGLINATTMAITKYINLDITPKIINNLKIEGNGSQRLSVPYSPINTLTMVKVSDSDITSECSIENNRTIYRENGFQKIRFSGIGDTTLPNYTKKNVELSFTSGYVMPTNYNFVTVTTSNSAGDLLITSTAHGLVSDTQIYLYGQLPNNLMAMTPYYVIVIDANTFKIATTAMGIPIGYLTTTTNMTYKIVDSAKTIPPDIEFITLKVCERLFGFKNRALNTVSYKGITTETYQLNGEFFTDEEKYILDKYKAVV